MALTLKTKTPVRFELSDGLVDTTVTLYGDDTEEVLVEKLKRVVALFEGPPAPEAPAAYFENFPKAPEPAPVLGNGWASVVPVMAPELPARLKGEVELIGPEEQEQHG